MNKVLGIGNGKTNPIVESVISNVAVGAGDPVMGDRSTRSELGRLQISFVEYEKRHGVSTKPYLDSIRKVMKAMSDEVIIFRGFVLHLSAFFIFLLATMLPNLIMSFIP